MARKPKTRRRAKSPKPSDSYLKFRTRWRHVLLIDQRIRSGQAPNCRQLAAEIEVSRRTILWDIDSIRYDLGAPVEYGPANQPRCTRGEGQARSGDDTAILGRLL